MCARKIVHPGVFPPMTKMNERENHQPKENPEKSPTPSMLDFDSFQVLIRWNAPFFFVIIHVCQFHGHARNKRQFDIAAEKLRLLSWTLV